MDMVLICEKCSSEFSVPFRKNKIGLIRFCSLSCFNSTKQKTVECKECKKSFVVGASSTREFCCNACYQKSRKRSKPVHRCEVCSKEFETTSTRKESARFCSVKCKSIDPSWKHAISEKTSAEKSWRWAGGKSQKTLSAYNKQVYRKLFAEHMQKKAPTHPFLINRNGAVCLSKHVHIHHIDKDANNNSIDNLLAITIDAHAKLHHTGRKPEPWECWPTDPAVW